MDLSLPIILDGEDKNSPFKNCLRKNYKHIRKWAKRTVTNCFRIYDRHLHHYPFAIDYYAGKYCIHYFSKKDQLLDDSLIDEVEQTLIDLFGCKKEDLFLRSRIKRKKFEQYEKTDEKKEFFTVLEYGVPFRINLTDYLDTGLFLDHRETRQLVANLAKDKNILNLFAYTCSFTVHAALKGAFETTSVDMSNTYTDWGRENYKLNHLDLKKHQIIRADCLKYLQEAKSEKRLFDLIIIDPPTISRSKKMDQMFDVQLDYGDLILSALKLLDRGGKIIFSTNSRRFSFDESFFSDCKIQEVSHKTLPIDFHDPKIHRCWIIER